MAGLGPEPWGTITLTVYVNCQRRTSKTKQASSTVATPSTPQVGPEAVATCPSGRAVAGGFSTPPPFTSTGAANTVIASTPSGRRGWRAEVVSSQASSLTSYVYCAKRKRARLLRSSPSPESVATIADTEAGTYASDASDGSCPTTKMKKRVDYPGATEPFGEFVPGAGGFSQQGATPSQYLVPTFIRSAPVEWRVRAIKVGSGTPVALSAVTLCG